MRSATRLLVVTLTGFIVALLPVHALAESPPSNREYGLVAAQQPTPPPTGPSTATTAQTIPPLTPSDAEEKSREQKRKLVMGITSAVLVGIVIWGRSIRRKKAKAS